MKTISFNTEIRNHQIHIPENIQSEISAISLEKVRVVLVFEDSDKHDDLLIQESATDYFLKGYAESDSIYDNYEG
jgi:hypothetical protein